jgi:hypothetical protein
MKKLAVLLVVFVLVLGSVSIVSAQSTSTPAAGNQQNQSGSTSSQSSNGAFQVAVNWDSSNTLTLSPTTVPANQPVEFVFNGQASNSSGSNAFVIFQGTSGDNVFSANGQQAVMQGSAAGSTNGSTSGSNNNTFTFTQEGTYTLAVFNTASGQSQATQTWTRADAQATADFTVSATASTTAAQSTGTATPESTATVSGTATMTSTVSGTTTPASTATPSSAASSSTTGSSNNQGPQNLPTTGGESAPWAMMALVLGALALLAGGVLLATRPDR